VWAALLREDPEGAVMDGKPVVEMTAVQYWARWAIAGGIALILARFVLVQPIIDAIQKAH
jgi:hypothetical protein